MGKKFTAQQKRRSNHPAGFALIVTLSLMVLLGILAVGLLGLSSVTLRSSHNGSAMAKARANARLALIVAIGELQKSVGPDQRITARAEIMARHPSVKSSVPTGSPKAWWVGVSGSDPADKSPGGSVVWLVSGLQGNSPAARLSSPLSEPVDMVGEGSLDLTLTGGQPIQAGKVPITNANGDIHGAYAYFVDDEGMKAQLVPSNKEVRNDSTAGPGGGPHGGGVTTGGYPPEILSGMADLGKGHTDQLYRLISTNDLPLVGLSKPVAKSKHFSYTISSRGVLADVKNGGLKKDLTAAFDPNPPAANQPHEMFRNAFPRNNPERFLAIDPKRLAEAPELQQNGYIHFGIFGAYYQLKNHLRIFSGGVVGLTASTIEKQGLLSGSGHAVYTGTAGPHSDWSGASRHPGHPYKDFTVFKDANAYRDNPITPILSSLQQNAWVTSTTSPARVTTHVQMFTSHYNPYNVGLVLNGDNPAHTGPRMMLYPQVRFTISGTNPPVTSQDGMHPKLQAHARGGLVISPGRSQALGFRTSDLVGREIDERLYSAEVGKLTIESVYKNHNSTMGAQADVTVEFINTASLFMQGVDDQGQNFEVSQVFYVPFAWDNIGGRPGKRVGLKGTQGVNNMAMNSIFLRTTREAGSRIRPLVDANIRAMWNNPRWDSPLGLPLLAAHSEAGAIKPISQLPQMNVSEIPYGFTYMGSDRDPEGSDRVILFDIPREDLVSIGQLQHASAGRFSYEPTYIVGNSYANLRIPLDKWQASVSDTFSAPRNLPGAGTFNLYDASFLVNERLWDEFIFTTIPQQNNNYVAGGAAVEPPLGAARYAAFLDGSALLPNPRFIPYEPRGSGFTSRTLTDTGNAEGTSGAFRHNAGHILVDGAFNVNSTSVDAWEAFLSGTHDLAVQQVNRDNGQIIGFSSSNSVNGVRFPRVKAVTGEGMKTAAIDDNYWTGFRELNQVEVRKLANAIVEEIRLRGPFLTMGEFVNRKLENSELGKSGALQAALDATVNKNLDQDFEMPADTQRYSRIAGNSTQGAGFPGQLLQGDLLQSLSPYMQVRSDTFTIRAYGEARNPVTGRTEAEAWCEATVQRVPDPLPEQAGGNTALQELISPGSRFGRELRAISFRWLHPDEI
jgi:hypothetical protein